MNDTKKLNIQYPEEPIVSTWRCADDTMLKNIIKTLLPNGNKHIILIDGRSGNGKSTFANKTVTLFNASLVRTDDIAWHYHPIDWDTILINNIINPWLTGQNVLYRPPGWHTKHRKGGIQVDTSNVLVIEGVGAGRASLATYSSLIIWVQANNQLVYDRALQRDMKAEGRNRQQAEDFWVKWKLHEDPFLAQDRPWSRAQLIINGTAPNTSITSTCYTHGPLKP